MDAEFIKAKIRIKYGRISNMAKAIGYPADNLYGALNGTNRSRPIERAIAKDLGTTAEELFPDRYQISA